MSARKYVKRTLIDYASTYLVVKNTGRMGRYNCIFSIANPLAAHQIHEAYFRNAYFDRALKYGIEKNSIINLNSCCRL